MTQTRHYVVTQSGDPCSDVFDSLEEAFAYVRNTSGDWLIEEFRESDSKLLARYRINVKLYPSV
jgi:hypothetical protein